MKRFIVFGEDGSPSYTFIPSDPEHAPAFSSEAQKVLEVPDSFAGVDDQWLIENLYLSETLIKERPNRPGQFYEWNLTSESWLPNLDAARKAKLQEVATELGRRLYLPCNGFDADRVSRERISGTIARLQRGDGLPAGWVGWRDACNDMHWATDDAATVLANLIALSRAIEDREQALLVASWAHKAAIAALEDIDAILGYDVTTGWPT